MTKPRPKTEIVFENVIEDLSYFGDLVSPKELNLTNVESAALSRKIKAFVGDSVKTVREIMEFIKPSPISSDLRLSNKWFTEHGFKVSAKEITYTYPNYTIVRFFVEAA